MTDISRRRNVAFVGPHHSGKTTLVDAILDHCGATSRRGSVADGSAVTDYEPECIEHKQSTCVGFAHADCRDVDLNIIDCPGFVDFFEETKLALLGADAAVVVIDAEPGRIAQTQSLIEFIESRRMPHLFVVNKLDRPGADFEATLAMLRQAYGGHVVAQQLPLGQGEHFSGYVDLIAQKAYTFNGKVPAETAVPGELSGAVAKARETLLEALSDFDDHLLEELLEGVEPPLEEIERDLCEDCSHDKVLPVVVAAGLAGHGVAALIDAIEREFPSPLTQPPLDAEGRPIEPRADGPVIVQVCKTFIQPQAGKLSVARVITGTLTPENTLVNRSQGDAKLRSSGLFRLQGKKQEPVKEAGPGSIVAIARLEEAHTGDTLVSDNAKVLLPRVQIVEPVFSAAIRPKDRLDEAKLSQMLARLRDEDPTLCVKRAEFTNELLLLGGGEAHITNSIERLARKYNLKVDVDSPQVPYRETIQGRTEVHSRYKHQTGGHGQFGDVWLRIEPRERGHGVSFEEKIVGGVVPRQFFPAVEKGVREALEKGPAGGYPVVDLHVTLYDGAYHDVDSSEASFKTAAAMGIRDGLPKCQPVLLEPIVRVAVVVPNTYTSTVISQLSGKRGQILGYNPAPDRAGHDIVEALVPHVEMARYLTELRTATQGLGTYTWRHERFEIVPGKVAAAMAH